MSIVKRGATWHICIYPPGGAKPIRRSAGTGDKRAAQELHDKIKAEIWRTHRLGEKPSRSWAEAALRYIKESASYDTFRLKWWNERLRGIMLSDITREKVGELLQEKREEGASNASLNRYTSVISTILRLAEREWEWIEHAPSFKRYEEPEGRDRTFSGDEEAHILGRAEPWLADMVRFALATGLRAGNIRELRWAWIRDRVVVIPRDKFKQRRRYACPLNRTAMEIISRQIGKHTEFVFTRDGEPLSKGALRYAWESAAEGLEDAHFHDLRHTWATRLRHAGVSLDTIEGLGGWSAAETVRRYAHLSDDRRLAAVEVLDRVTAQSQHTGTTGKT